MRKAFVLFLFLAGVGGANWLTMHSWNGTVYVYTGEHRAPASVRSVKDYSALDRRALYRSVHAQLMASAQLLRNDGSIGIQLGHPLVPRAEGGGREFACDVKGRDGAYDRMELTFYGTGITDNGNAPHLVVDTACEGSSRLDILDTIWIPMRDIVAAQPKDQEMQVSGARPEMIRLQNIPDQWPSTWVLWSVRFYRRDNPDESLTVDAAHLKESVSSLMSFDWNPAGAL
jgi:hypothetical protein